MGTLIGQLLRRMGLQDEPKLLDKTTELLRLVDLRSSTQTLLINEYGKIILCADLAARTLGIVIDKEQALKLSCLRKSTYSNHRRLIEKLLDLNQVMTIHDICVKLNLTGIENKADELLNFYCELMLQRNIHVDHTHPQYTTMAVYMACKLSKQRISKPKLISFSFLRPTQWQQLEQNWNKLITKYYAKSQLQNNNQQNLVNKKVDNDNNESMETECTKATTKSYHEIEDYETWKQSMLEMATRKLQQQATEANTA